MSPYTRTVFAMLVVLCCCVATSSSHGRGVLVAAFTPVIQETNIDRRQWFLSTITSLSTILLVTPTDAAHANLLEEFGADPTTKFDAANKSSSKTSSTSSNAATTVQIDPTLRGSYYYPTAKKRYLPRIQKVTDEITNIPDAIVDADWDTVQRFAKIAENAILPLQLYQSSLTGQGLSMSNSYAKIMKTDALQYEQSYRQLEKAILRRDREVAFDAVTNMGIAIADYRQQGRLKDDDGNIPSVEEMRRMTMRRPTIQVGR